MTTTNTSASSLQAKIVSVNTINEHTRIFLEHEKEALKSLIGSNPLKVDGTFKAKISHTKKEIANKKIEMFGQIWHAQSSYYLTPQYGYFVMKVRTCVTGGGADRNGVNKHCNYEDRTIDLIKIDESGIFCECDRLPQDLPQYNEGELIAIEREIKAAAEQYRELAEKMPYEFSHTLSIERLTR